MLKIGSRAPAFTLESDQDGKISLKDFKDKSVILFFYPKDLTPGCTAEACDFRDSVAQLKKLGACVLGVSKDAVGSHAKFRAKHALNFPLLSDSDGTVCQGYGVWQEKTLYGRKFMGIVRTTFVIGSDQKILKIFPKVKVKGHAAEVLEFLRG